MKRSIFIKILREEYILHEIKDDIISVLGNECGNVHLRSLKSLPENVHFNNYGAIGLDSLTSLPKNTQFNNGGSVFLRSLKYLPENTQFNNGGGINLNSLESIPENFQFNNGGFICFRGRKLGSEKSYIERHNIEVKDDKVILYKKVSKYFLTQGGKPWKTRWRIGSTVTHPNWEPEKKECGAGKYNASP